MGAAVRSTTTVASGSRANTSFTAPAGIQNGDILLIILSGGAVSPLAITPPTGFAIVDATWPMQYSQADPFTVRVYAWWKIAASESGSYTTSHTTGTTEGLMYAISGADATPINPTPTKTEDSTNPTDSALIASGLTTPNDGSLVVAVYGSWNSIGPASPPTGTTPTFTERKDSGVLYVADGVLATAGATGNKTLTSANAHEAWAAGLICIEAAAGGGALTGTSGATFSASGALTGAGALVGAGAIAFSQSAALSAAGALVGSTVITFGQSGALALPGLAGSASITFSQSGALEGAGGLAGQASVTFSHVAFLSGTGALSATGAVTFSQTGALGGTGALAGAAAAAFGQAGTLAGTGDLAGSAAITFAGSATADAPAGSIAGNAAISFSAIASLIGSGALSGTAAIRFNASIVSNEDDDHYIEYAAQRKRRKAREIPKMPSHRNDAELALLMLLTM